MEPSHPDRLALRKQLISAREALPETTRAAYESALLQHLQKLLETLTSDATSAHTHSTLGFCWPFRGEPDIRQTISTWLAADPERQAALPVVVSQDAPLAFRQWTPTSIMEPDRYGIPTPSDGKMLTPTLLLIPVNGFDARGYRLGYGGGYFDRTLESFTPAPLTIGIGFELSRLAHIEEGAHDKPLDWIVTEAGAFKAERA